jgi:hypothetical protein
MKRNDAAAPGHVCPGIRIHAIDIVRPPHIGISAIAGMDAHQAIVAAVLAAKSSAEMAKKARSEARPETMPAPMVREGARSGSLAGNVA